MKHKHHSGKGDRQVHARNRRLIQPRHEKLVDADPVVVDIFDQLQTEYRFGRIKHLLATECREIANQKHRDAERRIWTRLLDYLSNRFEQTD